MSTKRFWVAVAVVSTLAVGCGRLNDAGSGDPDAISHPTGADELILRVEFSGGFVPYEYTLSSLPSWSLLGDGTVIVQGPQIEIYPSPALPSVSAFRLSEAGIQAILRAARDAGLMDGDASYGNDCVADAATTVFTTNANGARSVVSAYALDLGGPTGDCVGGGAAARAELAEFQAAITDLASWLPEGSIREETPYEPSEMRVFVLAYRGEPELPQQPVEWPLDVPLDAFGEPMAEAPTEVRCGVVGGEDLAALLAAARGANQLTPWTSGSREHRLILRPLLPDEHAC